MLCIRTHFDVDILIAALPTHRSHDHACMASICTDLYSLTKEAICAHSRHHVCAGLSAEQGPGDAPPAQCQGAVRMFVATTGDTHAPAGSPPVLHRVPPGFSVASFTVPGLLLTLLPSPADGPDVVTVSSIERIAPAAPLGRAATPPPADITMADAGVASMTQGGKRSREEAVPEPRTAAAKRMALPEAATPAARQQFWGGREGDVQREGGQERAASVAAAALSPAQTAPAGLISLAATMGASSSAALPQPPCAGAAHICDADSCAAAPQGQPEPELCRECGQVEAECERICCPWAPSTQEAGRLATAHLESLPAEEYIAALAAASSRQADNALMLGQ